MLTTNAENLSSVALEEKMEEEKEEEAKSKVSTAEQEELDRMYEVIAAKQLEIQELAKKFKESTESHRLLQKCIEKTRGEIEGISLTTRKELGPTHMVGSEPITDKQSQKHHKVSVPYLNNFGTNVWPENTNFVLTCTNISYTHCWKDINQ